MQVIVEGKELEVTPALRAHAEKQARKVTKLSSQISEIRLFLETIKKKRNDPSANQVTYEVCIPGKNIVVKAHAKDMYLAISKATDVAARKLIDFMEKQREAERETQATE